MVNLVIALPENTYNEVLEGKDTSNTTIYEAIRNGHVLPKGHGDLIDREWLLEHMAIGTSVIVNAPRIIKADSEVE